MQLANVRKSSIRRRQLVIMASQIPSFHLELTFGQDYILICFPEQLKVGRLRLLREDQIENPFLPGFAAYP